MGLWLTLLKRLSAKIPKSGGTGISSSIPRRNWAIPKAGADVMRGQGSEVRSQPLAGIEEEHFGMNRNKQKTPQAGTIWMPAAVPGGSSGMAVKTGMRSNHETQPEPTLKRKVT